MSGGSQFRCPMFAGGLFVRNNGSAAPCCWFREEKKALPLKKEGLDWFGDLEEIRHRVLAGETPWECGDCIHIEKFGGKSQRQRFTEMYGDIPLTKSKFDPAQLVHLDLRLSNVCNFMCLMCSSTNSHLIAQERAGWRGSSKSAGEFKSGWVIEEMGQSELGRRLQFLSRARNLRELKLAGGEPFAMKKMVLAILENVSHLRDRLRISISTNVSVFDQEIVDRLNEFHQVHLHLSIDATGKYLEISRWGARWDKIQKNIASFSKALAGGSQLEITATLNVFTVLDLPNLIRWHLNQDAVSFLSVAALTEPSYYRSALVQPHALENVIAEIENMPWDKERLDAREYILALLREEKRGSCSDEDLRQFWAINALHEKSRNYQLREELPQLVRVLRTPGS